MTLLTGGCQCGAVRYALSAEPYTEFCHCNMCKIAYLRSCLTTMPKLTKTNESLLIGKQSVRKIARNVHQA